MSFDGIGPLPVEIATSVSGVIFLGDQARLADVLAAGVHKDLVLPLRPWDKPDLSTIDKETGKPIPKGAGKAPATCNGEGHWRNLGGWQRGSIDPRLLADADCQGSNFGLLMGVPVSDVDSADLDVKATPYSYLGIDIDLDPGMERHRNALLPLLMYQFGAMQALVRHSLPYRAFLLARMPGLQHGSKTFGPVLYKGQPIGKIEILGTGQQALIAGRHPSGNFISWERGGNGRLTSAPLVKDGVFEVNSISDAALRVQNALSALGDYEWKSHSLGGAVCVDDKNLAPSWLSPYDVACLVDAMANPPSLMRDRDAYDAIMHAISATMHGLKAHERLGPDGAYLIREAAVRWAVKWSGTLGADFERAKWETDYSRKPADGFRTDWFRLLYLAEGLCEAKEIVQEMRQRDAQKTFEADNRPISEALEFGAGAPEPEPAAAPETEGGFTADTGPRPAADGAEADDPKIFKLEWARDFAPSDNLELVKGWIGDGELAAIIGAPGSRKTTAVAAMACAIVHGVPWLGYAEVQQGGVLILELEGAAGLRHRVLGWHKQHGIEVGDAPLVMMSQAFSWDDETVRRKLYRTIGAVERELRKRGTVLRLVVLDTLARSAGSLDENQAGDMSQIVLAIDLIRGHTKAAFVILHHTGLSAADRARGSSALRGAWDAELLVEADGLNGTIKAQKMREREIPRPIAITAGKIDIGTKSSGEPITAPIITSAAPQAPEAKTGPGGNNGLALMALRDLIQNKGRAFPKEDGYPSSGQCASVSEWRNEFCGRLADKSDDTKQRTFRRAAQELQLGNEAKGVKPRIGIRDELAWILETRPVSPENEFEADEPISTDGLHDLFGSNA